MFLLVSGRHVGAHLNTHQHGVSTQVYKLEEKVYPHILHRKNCCNLNLGESLCIFIFFIFLDSGLYLLNNLFSLIYFEWRDTDMKTSIHFPWSWYPSIMQTFSITETSVFLSPLYFR